MTNKQDSRGATQDQYHGIHDIAMAITIMDEIERSENLAGNRPLVPNLEDSPCAARHSVGTREVCIAMDMKGGALAGINLALFAARMEWSTIWRCLYFDLPRFVSAVTSRTFNDDPYLKELGRILDDSAKSKDIFMAAFSLAERMELMLAERYGWNQDDLVMP